MADITGDQHVQAEVLEGLATAVNHRRWFVELAVPYLGREPIEIGSGLGDYALEWARHCTRFTASEADPDRLIALKERFGERPDIEVRQMLLPCADEAAYTSVVAYNVLEHITDDAAAVRSMAGLTRPGGAVVVIVPAFTFAMSRVDVATGHVRRYTRSSLSDVLTAGGLRVEQAYYVNALGLVGYYLATSVLRLSPKEGPMVKVYDSLVLPTTRTVERVLRLPFGQSVFAVARRPA